MKRQTDVCRGPILLPNTVPKEKRERIAANLIAWFRANQRQLPWRGAAPYAVWISEIMLQQTQVATVIPYFERFLSRFPTVEALASAPIDDVLHCWAGLGYYARARNLHRTAQIIVQEHGGRVPNTPEAIEKLPGIGRYTSGAILSIAYQQQRPLVDGNVIRVLSRIFGLRGDPKSAANQAALWSLAEQLIPQEAPGDFNQGLMELGALLCEPADPKCEQCPLLTECCAGNSADPSALPENPPGRSPISVTHSSALIRSGEKYLIVQRPLHGTWGGLWEFPRAACEKGETPQEGAIRAARETAGMEVTLREKVAVVKHGFTHFRITLYGFLAESTGEISSNSSQNASLQWLTLPQMQAYAFSAPQALLRDALILFQERRQSGEEHPSFDFTSD